MMRKSEFKDKQQFALNDWSPLIETLLPWEMWLKDAQLQQNHVKRAEQKHRHIMCPIKKVGKRSTGIGCEDCQIHAVGESIVNLFSYVK